MSSDPGKIVGRQKEALVAAIQDLENKECRRLEKLAYAKTKSDQRSLQERFDRERKIEKEKVEALMTDYFVIEERLKKDGLRDFIEQRATLKKQQSTAKSPFGENQQLPNRFEGIECHEDIVRIILFSFL